MSEGRAWDVGFVRREEQAVLAMKLSRRRLLKAGIVTAPIFASNPPGLFAQPTNSDIELVSLENGRRLGIQRYGDRDGVPVLYMHGTPGSRTEASLMDEACRHAQVDLWAIDRPGMGLSPFESGRSVRSWSNDIRQVLAYIQQEYGISRVGVLGYSGGTPYALAAAEAFPNTIIATAILAPRAPGAPGVARGVVDKSLRQAQRHPRLARLVLDRYRQRLIRRPQSLHSSPISALAQVDQQFAARHSRWLEQVYLEATRCGTAGVMQDLLLLPWPWCVEISETTTPVSLWLGACDLAAPRSTVEFLASRIPQCEANILPAEGHLSVLEVGGALALEWLGDQMKMGFTS